MDRQRLIVVLNRQPYEHRWESDQLICARTDGGLTAALDLVLRRYGGTRVAQGSGSADQDVVGPDMCIEVPPARHQLLQEGRIRVSDLFVLYRMADCALVSSVNDGMNLAAKEYVAAQVCETGVLLVSQMAGASEELPGASVINPYEIEGLAETIKDAIEMPLDESRRRMRRMRSYLAAHDIHACVEGCRHDALAGAQTLVRAVG